MRLRYPMPFNQGLYTYTGLETSSQRSWRSTSQRKHKTN